MVRTIHIVIVLALSGVASRAIFAFDAGGAEPGALRATSTGETPLQTAITHLDAGDAAGALAVLKARNGALRQTDRLFVRGRARLIQDKLSAARRDLLAAIKLQPRRAELHYWLGRVYQSDGAQALAASSFQKAYLLGMGTADLHYHWSLALLNCDEIFGDVRQQNWSDDRAEAPEAGTFDYEGLVVGPVRGRPNVVLVAPRKSAIYQIHKAIEADERRGDALLAAGGMWGSLDRHAMAASLYRRASKRLKGEDLAACHRRWAESSLALGRLDSYIEHIKAEMELTGGVDVNRLAECYTRASVEASARGNLPKQTRYLTLAAETSPSPARYIQLADVLLLAQRGLDAERYLKLALQQKPTKRERSEIKLRLVRTTYLATPAAAK